jgi:N-acylglucosamine-6-phosphate 2-epimerase
MERQDARLSEVEGGLIVSAQAFDGSPLRDSRIMAALALAALQGGAVGLRINGPDDISAVRPHTDVPIIGLHKVHDGRRNLITPNLDLAAGLVAAGADILAIDATEEVLGTDFSYLTTVREELGRPVMADTSTLEEGLRAWDQGVSVVGTTLSGYTPQTRHLPPEPDLGLVESLANSGVRVIAEGRYRSPLQVAAAFNAGAFAVVVGGAITDPSAITASFAATTPRARVVQK